MTKPIKYYVVVTVTADSIMYGETSFLVFDYETAALNVRALNAHFNTGSCTPPNLRDMYKAIVAHAACMLGGTSILEVHFEAHVKAI